MTQAESNRIARMMRLGCCACACLEMPYIAEECHHILEGNTRLGHWYTIGLCRGHHRGCWTDEQIEAIDPDYRVAISDGRKVFTLVYPAERILWETTQDRLKLPKLWPVSKILPRSVA
jgi:hypothetical protein